MNKQKDPTRIDEFIAPDNFDHTNQLSREGAKQFYAEMLRARWKGTVDQAGNVSVIEFSQ